MHITTTALTSTALLLAACSVLPTQVHPPSDEREVIVRYVLEREQHAVEVPASSSDLTVLWLETEPADLRESFEGGVRRLHLDATELVIRCRYRAYARSLPDTEEHALPDPEHLFPGASSIETVWHRDLGPSQLQPPTPR